MSGNPPNIPITPEFDLTRFFKGMEEMEARATAFAQKFNRLLSGAVGTDPKTANQLLQTLKNAETIITDLESRATRAGGVIQKAIADATQSAAQSVSKSFQTTLDQITQQAVADLKKAQGVISAQGGGSGGNGGRGPSSGVGPSSPRFPARDALADVNKTLDDFANQSPFQRVVSGLRILEKSLRSDLPAAADITEAAIAELNSILRSGSSELDRNQRALEALERTQRAIQSVQVGSRVRQHLVGGERDNAIRDEGKGSTTAANLDDEYKRLTRATTLYGDAQTAVGKGSAVLRGEIRSQTAELKKQTRATEEHEKAVRKREAAERKATEASRLFGKEQLGSRDALISLLGVSRFLPGALGQVFSGVSLLSGGIGNVTGQFIAMAGSAFAAGVQLFQVGRRFNEALNQTRAQAEGLGLTVDEVRAFQFVLTQTGGSIENFAVGIKKINQALTGIGPEARETRVLLEGIFAGSGFKLDDSTKTVDVIKQIASQIDSMEKSGLGAAVAGEIFGRSWDEVKGRLKDLNEQLEEAEALIKKTGITSKEAQATAKSFAREIAELDLRWDSLVDKLKIPAIANVTVKFATDVSAGLEQVFDKIPTVAAALLAANEAKKAGASGKSIQDFILLAGGVGAVGQLAFLGGAGSKNTTESETAKQADAIQATLAGSLKKFEENSQLEGAAIERLRQRLQARRGTLSVESIKAEEIAIKQRENELLTVQIAELNKGAKSTDIINATDRKILADQTSSAEEKATSQARLNVNLEQVLILEAKSLKTREEQNRLRKEIADLTSEGRNAAQKDAEQRFTENIERLFESRQGLIPGSESFASIQNKIESQLQSRIGELEAGRDAGTDPGAQQELNTRLAELRRRQKEARKETTRQLFQDAEQALTDRKQIFAQAIALLDNLQEEFKDKATREFESGGIDFNAFVAQEATFILQRVELLRDANRLIISDIDAQISDVRNRLQSGAIDPLDAASKFTQLKRDRGSQIQQGLEGERKAKSAIIKLENDTTRQLIEARQQFIDLDIRLTERTNERRLELLTRAAEFSLTLEDATIRERRRMLAAQNDSEIGALLTLLQDKKELQAQINGLNGGQADVGFSLPGVISRGNVEELRRVISDLSAAGVNQSGELIGVLEQAVELIERRRDLEQEMTLSLLDVQIKKEKAALEIRRQGLAATEQNLVFEQQRLEFLEENELLSKFQLDEKRVQIERRRLDLMIEQAKVLKEQALSEARRRVEAVATSDQPLSEKVLLEIVNSEEIASLNLQFTQLTGESRVASDNLDVLNSSLGVFYTGIQDVVDTLATAPEPFDKLAKALSGVRSLAAAFLAPRVERRNPAQELQAASKLFNNDVTGAAREFYRQVVESSTGIAQTIREQKIEVSGSLNKASTVLTTSVIKAAADIESAVTVFKTTSDKIASSVDDNLIEKLKGIPDGVKPVFDNLSSATTSLADVVKAAAERISKVEFLPPGSKPASPPVAESQADGGVSFLGTKFTKEELEKGKRTAESLQNAFTPWWVKEQDAPRRRGGRGKGGTDPNDIGPNIDPRIDVRVEVPTVEVVIDPRSIIALSDSLSGKGAGLSTNQIVRATPTASGRPSPILPDARPNFDLSQLPTSLPELPRAANAMLDEIEKTINEVEQRVKARRNEIVNGVLSAANQAIGGIASGSAGGLVAGLGGAAGALTDTFAKNLEIFGAAAGPVIGGIAQVAGGIMEFIGGIWKARAEKIATEMSQNFKLIQDNFNSGVITLGQAIKQTQDQLVVARQKLGSGKINKKGGGVALQQIEQQANDQIAQFKQRQKEIQKKFLDNLAQLNRPESVRSLYNSIEAAFDDVKEYLRSFETGAESLKHMAEAQEFLNRTFQELKDKASSELDDLIKREQDARRAFGQQRDALINEGRVQTPFEDAQDKLARLFDLERKRVEEQAENESDQFKLRQQLDVIDKAFDRSDKVLDRLADVLGTFTNELQRMMDGNGGFFRGAINQGREQAGNVNTFYLTVYGGDPNSIRKAGDELGKRLEQMGLANRVIGSYNPARPHMP